MTILEQLLNYGLDAAMAGGAEYAELTAVDIEEKKLHMQNARLASSGNREAGISVRLIAGGRWGFAAGPAANKTNLSRLVKAALEGALVQPPPVFPAGLSTVIPAQGSWTGPCVRDPFAIPDSQLAELLVTADQAMAIEGVSIRQGSLHFRREHRFYVNSEGSSNSQTFTYTGGSICALAFGQGEIQQRSWPSPGGSYAKEGYEYIEELDLPGHGRQIAQEAVALTKAPSCPQEALDLVLTGSLLASQVHYTLGYRLQLGMPGAVHPQQASRLKLGSSAVTIYADAALPGGAGSFGFDSEGVKAQSFPLLENGRIVNFLSGRETAAAAGRFSGGCMRSGCWLEPPMPWMTNLVIKPGTCSLAELAGGIERGLLLDTPRAFGVSPDLRGFAAQAELGWLIEDGVITHMVKNPFYRGNSRAFWSGCDAAAAAAHQKNLGLMDKGIAVGHSIVPVRIRGVRVGDSR